MRILQKVDWLRQLGNILNDLNSPFSYISNNRICCSGCHSCIYSMIWPFFMLLGCDSWSQGSIVWIYLLDIPMWYTNKQWFKKQKLIRRWNTLMHHLFTAGFAVACCVWGGFSEIQYMRVASHWPSWLVVATVSNWQTLSQNTTPDIFLWMLEIWSCLSANSSHYPKHHRRSGILLWDTTGGWSKLCGYFEIYQNINLGQYLWK